MTTAEPAHAADSSSLVEQAHHAMRRNILDNVWPPGYQKLESEIALELGMSRTPVREALIRLQTEGLVEIIPRRGVRILPVSPQDMAEMYEILTALECLAVELVARSHPTEEQLKPLTDATNTMERALKKGDLTAWAKADEDFHHALVNLSANRMLVAAMLGYWDRIHRARMFTLRLRPLPVASKREHRALVEHLRKGDVQAAVEENRLHRKRASRELLAIFQNFQLRQL